jgi:hypothetical protein
LDLTYRNNETKRHARWLSSPKSLIKINEEKSTGKINKLTLLNSFLKTFFKDLKTKN